jgi:hypothetical protein
LIVLTLSSSEQLSTWASLAARVEKGKGRKEINALASLIPEEFLSLNLYCNNKDTLCRLIVTLSAGEAWEFSMAMRLAQLVC